MEDFFAEEEEDWGSPTSHLLAGAVAGTVEHCGMFPLDTIKTHIQAQNRPVLTQNTPVLSLQEAAQKIISQRGVGGLFRGLNAMVAGAAPAHAVYFMTYELFKGIFGGKKGDDKHHPIAYFSAGVVATVFSEGVFTPMDTVKQKLQLGFKQYGGVIDCCRKTYSQQGLWRGFYAGYTTTLVMNVPYSGVYFASYEFFKQSLLPEGVDHSNIVNCVAGGGAGVISAALTNPLDVARTRLQTQSETTVKPGDVKYRGMYHALRVLWQEEGARGFRAGILPRMIFHSTSAAICWATYEYVKHLLGG